LFATSQSTKLSCHYAYIYIVYTDTEYEYIDGAMPCLTTIENAMLHRFLRNAIENLVQFAILF